MILLLGLCALSAVIGIVLIGSDGSAAARSARTNGSVLEPVSQGRRRLDRLSAGFAALALLWVVGAVLALFFVPMITEESSSSSAGSNVVTVTRETHPLIQSSGSAKVAAALVAALVVAVGWRLGRPPRLALLVMGYLATAFCVITGFSIGLFFFPVPFLLVAAGATSQPRSPRPAASSGREY